MTMPLWRRWWFGILCLFLLAVGGIAFNVYWQRREAEAELRQVLAELDEAEPDWRLDRIEAKRREVPDGENGALAVIAAFQQLPKEWQTKAFGDDARRARQLQDELASTPPCHRYHDEVVKQLRLELDSIQPAVIAARKLIDYPRGRFPIKYTPDVFSTVVADQQGARAVANVVILDAYLALHDGHPSRAWPAARTLLNIGRTLADEPLLISQLIRLAMHVVAVQCMERTLAHATVSDTELAAMAALLPQERDENLFLVGMRGERAGSHQFMALLESGDTPIPVALDQFINHRKQSAGWLDHINDVFVRKSALRSHSWLLRYFTKIVEAAELPVPDRYSALQDLGTSARDFLASGDIDYGIAKVLAPAVVKVADAEQRGDTLLNCTIAALAAERFRLKHQRWPHSLGELIEAKLLKNAPEDLYDGKPIRLRRTADGIVFYSVGKDGNYQGDALDRLEDFDPNRFRVEFRLWDPAKRRQPPLPPRKPAEAQ